jgi:hypothetical protein
LHLLGRPISEGDAEHLLGSHILRGNQPGGAPGDYVGLAAAGSGEHEQGSGRRSDCRQLRGIEIGQQAPVVQVLSL